MGLEERTQTREFEGAEYEVTPVPAGIGLKLLKRLIDIIAPVFAAVVREQGGSAQAGAMLAAVPEAFSDADLERFAKEFGKQSKFKNGTGAWLPLNDIQRDLHFGGNYVAFLKWLTFCLEVNFSNFFESIASGEASPWLAKFLNKG